MPINFVNLFNSFYNNISGSYFNPGSRTSNESLPGNSIKALSGAKAQLAEVFHTFVTQACRAAPMEEAKQDLVGRADMDEAYSSIME